MNCMKCGREIPAGQVFCKDCLQDMERFPVKPDTPVQLPVRPVLTTPKRPARFRRAPSTEEQILRQKKLIHRLIGAMITMMLLFGMFAAAAVYYITRDDKPAIGQNYSTAQPSDSTGASQP